MTGGGELFGMTNIPEKGNHGGLPLQKTGDYNS